MVAKFADIQAIFNRAMQASQGNIGNVDLHAKHQEQSFPNFYGNFTNAQFQAGQARGMPLIQPGIKPPPGQVGNQGDQANIVKALRGQLPNVRQMPGGGPAMSDPDIATLVDWINHGCPD
jgi:hypothetical protein